MIDLGDRVFEVMHLPGYSPGSIGLWEARSETQFSGDAIYDGPLLDEIPGSDITVYFDTMLRLDGPSGRGNLMLNVPRSLAPVRQCAGAPAALQNLQIVVSAFKQRYRIVYGR